MLQRIVLCVVLSLGLTLHAQAAEKQQLEFTGRLVDLSFDAPDCGTLQFDTLAVYDRVEGAGLPDKVYVVHPCIELARSKYSRSAGTLQQFVIGQRHHLVVSRTAPARPGALVRGSIDSGTAPIFHVTKVDLAVTKDPSLRTVADLNLGDPGLFAPSLQEAVRAVAQVAQPAQDFSAQIELDHRTHELVFRLSHKDAFLPANQNMLGNPGGKCRDVYYNRQQHKVVRTLFWQ